MSLKKCVVFGGLLVLLLNSSTANNVKADESLVGLTSSYMRLYIDSNDTIGVINSEFVQDGDLTLFSLDGKSQLLSQFAVADVQSYVNIRESASIDGDVLGRLYRGAVATAVDTDGEWTKIISGSIEGYVKTEFLVFGQEAVDFSNEFYASFAKVTSSTLNLRSGAGLDYSVVIQLKNGAELEVLEKTSDWYKVRYKTVAASLVGYVSTEYISTGYKYAMPIADALALEEKNSYDVTNIIWPLPADHSIHSYFGKRVAPTAGASTFHRGLDIGGSYGSSIVAAMSGTVVETGYDYSAGNYVEISHGNGICTRYYHCSEIYVSAGEKVTQGERIAAVGSTGIATGSHLHFAMTVYGDYVDPYPYLKAVQ